MVATALPADDLVVKVFDPQGKILFSHDLLTSPEVATYSADAIPAGTYTLRICPFDDASAVVGAYTAVVSTSDVAVDAPSAANPRWRYFADVPSMESTATGVVPDNTTVGCWSAGEGCEETHDNVAAPGPWDLLLSTGGGVPSHTTVGNNAHTHEAWLSPLTPGGLFQAPVSPTREYTPEFTDAWNESQCDPTQLVPGGNDIEASVASLFAAHNRMHDFSYYLGFTEENYNLQADNLGRGGVGGDPEVGNAQAGAADSHVLDQTGVVTGRNNANQVTLQDGIPGITNQYLFQPLAGAFYAPCTDGGLDMGIVGHEYTHAISNRMVAGPDEGLTSEQGGAMGESWSDLVAGEYMFSHGYDNGGNPWAVGAYATGNTDRAIRDYAIDDNPLNYSNYGFDSTGPEVHADGEIWNGTQWEVRQALVEKWDARFPYDDAALQRACARATGDQTPRPADQCPGNRRWIQLMFDSMLLQANGAVSMLDMRDAMLAADQLRFGGENAEVMWRAFARRGMGRDASSPDADSDEPTPSFASPAESNVRVTFAGPANGKVFVGDYEARVTPIADTDSATELPAAVDFVPGRYQLLFVSPGGGFERRQVDLSARRSAATVTFADQRNLAGAANGATVIGATEGSRNPGSLIDGTEQTNWGGVTGTQVDESNPSVAVDLAGGTHVVRRVQVSAMLTPAVESDPDSGSRFTALRKFALEACTADCGSAEARWTRFYTSPDDAFPAVAPRPVAPDLAMRSFDVPPTTAAAVRLVTLENQCTGYEGFAGELDADPVTTTDCKTGSDRGTIVHAAELQVYGGSATAPTKPDVAGACADRQPPRSRLARQQLSLRAGNRLRAVGSTAEPGCAEVRVVRWSLAKVLPQGRCAFLRADGRFGRATSSCGPRGFTQVATGTKAWRVRTPALARGTYHLWVRAKDSSGNVERPQRSRNLLRVTVT